MDEIEERRRRADAAWAQLIRDAHHVGEAAALEVEKVKRLGAATMRSITAQKLFESSPLAVAGAALGVGFVVGWRGGQRRATLRAIAAASSAAIAALPPAPQALAARTLENLATKRLAPDPLVEASTSPVREESAFPAS